MHADLTPEQKTLIAEYKQQHRGSRQASPIRRGYRRLPSTVDRRAQPGQPLTDTEADIIRRLAAGAYDGEIAEALEISGRHYRRHVVAAQRKLGARTRAHAVALAAAVGLIELTSDDHPLRRPPMPDDLTEMRDRMARALAQPIYGRDDPSWPLLEVCQPYADAVMAVVGPELERARHDAARILQIVSDWCTEANNIGGVDATDLAWRLETAGYMLPDEEIPHA
ncbi:helix-turn-helix domain-containing protein [Actinomadura alba]|uniref:Helix-turn-helix transcriptional regulator n=1 Tax=Actinomadura alba TaxID=406431 RepID=A0ABR7LIE4_9ACTN|nr:helix-turn-helix transcriptional regulator [Actinomadura alba]MBC6464277.1 helix-turn-helix transcriptional regulator [Actinomadura alba]